jgi:hypothetical protein
MASRSRSLAAALGFGLLASTLDAAAAEPNDGGRVESARRRVVVLSAAGGTLDPSLIDTIRELVARLDLELREPDAATPPDAVLAGVRIDLSSPSDAVLTLTDGRTAEVRLRRSIPRDASTAIAREEIAHAVQSGVEAQLVAERDRPPEPPPQPPAPPPAVAAPARVVEASPVKEAPARRAAPSPFALDFTTLAGVGPLASGSGPNARVGGGLAAMWRAGVKPSLSLDLTYAPPSDTGSPVVSSHASVVSLRAVPALEVLHAGWFALDLGAGLGFDLLTVAPRSEQLPPTNLYAQTSRVDPIVCGVATAHAAIAAGVVLLLSAAADVDLEARHYVLSEGATQTDVLSPWRVRPMILAGFGFTAIGEGHSPPSEAR